MPKVQDDVGKAGARRRRGQLVAGHTLPVDQLSLTSVTTERIIDGEVAVTAKGRVLGWEASARVPRRRTTFYVSRRSAQSPIESAHRRIVSQLEMMPTEVVQELLLALNPGAYAPDEAIWGDAPSVASTVEDIQWHKAAYSQRLDAVLESSFTRDGAAKVLGVQPSDVDRLVAKKQMSVIEHEEVLLFPGWQFDGGSLLPGVPELVSRYPSSAVSLAAWAERYNKALGTTPVHALGQGRMDEVLAVAETQLALS